MHAVRRGRRGAGGPVAGLGGRFGPGPAVALRVRTQPVRPLLVRTRRSLLGPRRCPAVGGCGGVVLAGERRVLLVLRASGLGRGAAALLAGRLGGGPVTL
ncbi:hypothetical protein, partial [Actinomadura sp. BRA 177]|uniref:hypothetical protein n=1 Tax=Actinomadura sp. BRA 177 TaxID=2745202 RepID=UPI001C3C1CC5